MTLARLLQAGIVALALATPPARAADQAPPRLPELIPTLLPHVVNIAFTRLELEADGAIIQTNKGLGSGYVVDERGIIATNKHVTDGGNVYSVTFANNLQLRATLIYRSPDIDMALLQVFPAEPLSPVKWGDSDRMQQGDPVIAIGNPLGLAGTVTTGIVSARDRDIRQAGIDAFLQIDAAINPGNSGGPLFNMRGEAIGMNSAFFSVPGADASGSIGLNFAIPGNDVRYVLDSLRKHGRVQRGYLGALMQDVTGELDNALDLASAQGAIVAGVIPGSPADQAGLQIGDVLKQIGKYPVRTLRDALRAITVAEIGQPTTIGLQRAHRPVTVSAVLKDASTETATVNMAMTMPTARPITEKELGITNEVLSEDLRTKYKLPPGTTGVVFSAVRPGGLADSLGFKAGDVVLRAQDEPLRTVQDLINASRKARAEKRNFMALLVVDSNGTHWATVPLTD